MIFRDGLKWMFDNGERTEADAIYEPEAPVFVKVPGELAGNDQALMRNRVKKRHETINKRLKVFGSLDVVFRHDIAKHSSCFRLAAVCLQLAFDLGQQELFDCLEYDDSLTDEQATEIFGV